MKKELKQEILLYILFGILTTLVYLIMRFFLFLMLKNTLVITGIANITSVLFAFFTNDIFVFRQVRNGWWIRLVKFTLARLSTVAIDLLLAFIFIDAFPNIIGQFVHHQLNRINFVEALLSQIIIIIVNYLLSKLIVFKNTRQNKRP